MTDLAKQTRCPVPAHLPPSPLLSPCLTHAYRQARHLAGSNPLLFVPRYPRPLAPCLAAVSLSVASFKSASNNFCVLLLPTFCFFHIFNFILYFVFAVFFFLFHFFAFLFDFGALISALSQVFKLIIKKFRAYA